MREGGSRLAGAWRSYLSRELWAGHPVTPQKPGRQRFYETVSAKSKTSCPRDFVHNGEETQKSWTPLRNTIFAFGGSSECFCAPERGKMLCSLQGKICREHGLLRCAQTQSCGYSESTGPLPRYFLIPFAHHKVHRSLTCKHAMSADFRCLFPKM